MVGGWYKTGGGGQTNGGEKSSALTTDKHNPDYFVSPRYKDIHDEGHFVKDKHDQDILSGEKKDRNKEDHLRYKDLRDDRAA